MIATWMVASMALAAALGAAALLLERALRLLSRQGRAPWTVAIVGAVAWPVLSSALARPDLQVATVRALNVVSRATVALPEPSLDTTVSWLARLQTLDQPLLVAWLVFSALLLLRMVWAMAALHRAAHRAPLTVVDDTAVRMTADIGPAVFALWNSHLLLPRWLLDLDEPLRRLVMAHEREHVRARDPQLIVATFVLVALMPWNAPLWWLARRLRTASELDCDARVLRAGADAHTYGHLLLLIAQRQANARFLPMMAGAPSTLHARIIAMSVQRPPRPALRAAFLSVVALALLALGASPALARPLASARLVLPSMLAPIPQGAQPTKAPATTPTAVPTKATVKDVQYAVPRNATKDTGTAKTAKPVVTVLIDKQVVMAPGSAAPRYPEILKSAGITGSTHVMFVVDTNGSVDESTLKVIRTAHPLFVEAVKVALPGHRFHPALVGSRPVKQLVQVVYRFATVKFPALDSVQTVKNVPAFEIMITGNDQQQPAISRQPLGIAASLYVVDGMRVSRDNVMKLPAERIEKVEVLKGDAARAKYGDDGKYGVILITTKPR